jgi:hypothetical protein
MAVSWIVVAGLVLVCIVVVSLSVPVWRDGPRLRAQRLRERFGPEYEMAVERHGERRALRLLEARERRVSRLPLRALSSAERAELSEAWLLALPEFVDAPGEAVQDAHALLLRTLQARGYQIEDFDQCLADVSVDYAGIVQHLRAAHALARANPAGALGPAELEQALVHYRILFEGLLGTPREEIAPSSERYQPALEHHDVSAR